MKKSATSLLSLLPALLTLSLGASAAPSGSTKAAKSATGLESRDAGFEVMVKGCESLLTNTPIARYQDMSQSWALGDLLNPDPVQNLAVRYPTILMNSDQRIWFTANYLPTTKKRDPAYRIDTFDYYPVVSAGIAEARGGQIIGHYETISRAMAAIKARAQGKKSGKMVGFIGPAGTGKTEILNLLSRVEGVLAMTEPQYTQLTFEFTDLDQIPQLTFMTFGSEDGTSPVTKDVTLNRSPLVLLPPHLQDEVIKIGTPEFVAKMKMAPLPFRTPTLKTQKVIDAIVQHYAKKEGLASVSDRDYLRFINRHVRLVRRVFDTNQPTPIIRYLGKNPNMDALFFTENMTLSQFYGTGDPRSYTYGLIPGTTGGLYVDEFFRQGAEVRDSFLDLGQNNVIQSNGAPAEMVDVTVMFATNDESIVTAQQDGGAKAHLNRTVRLPMRHALEPMQVAKIMINDIGAKDFKMRRLEPSQSQTGAALAPLEPYDKQKVFPDTDDGAAIGSDGRYALYYQPSPSRPAVLISPHALSLITLTAVASRLVTDEKVFEKANSKRTEFSTYAKNKHMFTDPATRIQILLGEFPDAIANGVLTELSKARSLLREGKDGIGAREVENWLLESLNAAQNSNESVTPVKIDELFERLVNGDGITATDQERDKWKELQKLVKHKFLLPALTADVLNILQGQGRVESVYDDLKREIFALSNDEQAEYVESEGNRRQTIDKIRLQKIYQIYASLGGGEFDPGMLKNFHLSTGGGARHPILMSAVRTFLARKELETVSVSEILNYFEGRSTTEGARLRGAQAEAQLEANGYDRFSFTMALSFVKDTQFEIEKIERAGR